MNRQSRIFVAGSRGLVGSAVVRALRTEGYYHLILPSRTELDLLDQGAVRAFFGGAGITHVFLLAGRVGGIHANSTQQARFLYENLMIAANVIDAAHVAKVEKLLYVGSSCIYPKQAPQPIPETALLGGPLEPTNEGYAIAKIAGLKLCEMYSRQYGDRFISAMPTNLYGPNDNFDPLDSHVIPGMLRRFYEANEKQSREVLVWGTGSPLREFLHVDDLAGCLMMLMQEYQETETINVGSGEELSIAQVAHLIKEIVGFEGNITFDASKPDGTPRKIVDSHRVRQLGWTPKIDLRAGLQSTYAWALEHGPWRVQQDEALRLILLDDPLSAGLAADRGSSVSAPASTRGDDGRSRSQRPR